MRQYGAPLLRFLFRILLVALLVLSVHPTVAAAASLQIVVPASMEVDVEGSAVVSGDAPEAGRISAFTMQPGAPCPATPYTGEVPIDGIGSEVSGSFSVTGAFTPRTAGPQLVCAYLERLDGPLWEVALTASASLDAYLPPPSLTMQQPGPGAATFSFSGRAPIGGATLAAFITDERNCPAWDRNELRYGPYYQITGREVFGRFGAAPLARHVLPGWHSMCAYLLAPGETVAVASLSQRFHRSYSSWVPAGKGPNPRAARWRGTARQSLTLGATFEPFSARRREVTFRVRRGRILDFSAPVEMICDVDNAGGPQRWRLGRLKIVNGRVNKVFNTGGDKLSLQGRFLSRRTFRGTLGSSYPRGFDTSSGNPGYCTGVANFSATVRG